MTDREKMIDLIINAKRTDPETRSFAEYLADFPLGYGVKLPTSHPGKPLTLDQLREMDGQPVWIKSKRYGVRGDVVHIMGLEDGERYVRFEVNPYLRENGYGKTWLAYSYPPAQQRWIPVSEEEPGRNQDVLIYDARGGGMQVSRWWQIKDFDIATHWMPLPQPPSYRSTGKKNAPHDLISRSALLEGETEPEITTGSDSELAEQFEWRRWMDKIKRAPAVDKEEEP